MNKNFQFKIVIPGPDYDFAIYDPIINKFIGPLAFLWNKYLQFHDSINYTVLVRQLPVGDCDTNNCTGAIGLVQRGEGDFLSEKIPLATLPDLVAGLKPGPVLKDLICNIATTLPEIKILREDVLKSFSIFTLDVIIFLAFFLFSISFILRYFNVKFRDIETSSPPIIWPLICAMLSQKSSKTVHFNCQTLRFIWISIIFTLFFMTAFYTASFTTDLSSKMPIKTIDSLEDVANSGKLVFWTDSDACRLLILNNNSSRIWQKISMGGRIVGVYDFVNKTDMKEMKIEECILIVSSDVVENFRLGYCAHYPDAPVLEWHQSSRSFPVQLLFHVLNARLSPDATKIINKIHSKRFEGRLDIFFSFRWKRYFEKSLEKKKYAVKGCSHKIAIISKPALYRFNQLDVDNYKLFFKRFLYIVPICILSLISEYFISWKTRVRGKKQKGKRRQKKQKGPII